MNLKTKIRHNYRKRIRNYRIQLIRFKKGERKTEPTFCKVCEYAKCRCEQTGDT